MSSKKKQCKQCRRNLPVTEFYHYPKNADRLLNICKADFREARVRRYHDNPDARRRDREQAHRWRKENPLRSKAQRAANSANARACKSGSHGRLTADDVLAVWETNGYRCAVCKKNLAKKDRDLTIDHQDPLEFGGSNTPDNLRCACQSCNSKEYWKCRRERAA